MTKIKNQIENIINDFQQKGEERRSSGAYIFSGHNVAKDMLAAVAYAREIVYGFEFTNNAERDSLDLSSLIENSREEFEQIHTDPEYYGTGTLKSISDEVLKLTR